MLTFSARRRPDDCVDLVVTWKEDRMLTFSARRRRTAGSAPAAGNRSSAAPARSCAAGLAAAAFLTAAAAPAFAQSTAPGAIVVTEEIVVRGRLIPEEERAEEKLDAIPGGTGLVAAGDLDGQANLNLSDALSSTPGVIVQNFFGGNDQPRVQIRGSGLQQNPVERGVLVLQNGLPMNRADGSYVVGLADPVQARFTEVYRGYTANRLGATVLGGALNFVSPTGSSAPGFAGSFEGGGFGLRSGSVQAGGDAGALDGLVQASFSRRDGFRERNESSRLSFEANVGGALTDTVSTRLFVGYTDLGFDVVGPLTADEYRRDPRRIHPGPTVRPNPSPPPGLLVSNPGPNVGRDQPQREVDQFRLVSRTTAAAGAQLVDAVLGYSHTDDAFRFPIPAGIRETRGGDFSSVLRYAYGPDPARALPLFESTAKHVVGSAARNNFTNRAGTPGPLFGRGDLEAGTLSLHAGLNVPVNDVFTVSPGVAWARARRGNTDTFGAPLRPTIAFNPGNPRQPLPDGGVPAGDTSYSRTYGGWSPSLGLTLRAAEDQTVFAAVSRSFEPPTHDDLLATVGGTPFSSAGRPRAPAPTFPAPAFATPALEAQTATTAEAGWRGDFGAAAWDVVTYYARVDNELLSLRDATGAPLGAVNADRTRRFGIEFGQRVRFTEEAAGRLVYTYQNFRFDGDPLRGDNRLAGAPPHVVNGMLQYGFASNARVRLHVDWRPGDTPVDNMNTLFNESFVLVSVRGNYDVDDRFSLFVDVRNVFDETYASSTLILDLARPDQAAFLPGDGRAVYLGVRVR